MPKTKEIKNTLEKGLLLDVTYFDENEESIISLFVKGEKKHYWLKDKEFRPYLYVLAAKGEEEKIILELKNYTFGGEENFKVNSVKETKMEVNKKTVLKVEFKKVSHLVQARKNLSELGFEKYEYDVPFAKRYLLDKRLEPGNWVEYEVLGEEDFKLTPKINSLNEKKNTFNENKFKPTEEEDEEIITGEIKEKAKVIGEIKVFDAPFCGTAVSFDLETYFGKKFGIGFEPIVMVSVVSNDLAIENKDNQGSGSPGSGRQNYERVMSYNTQKVSGLELVLSEKELISETALELNKVDTSFIVTYNGDNFDFAYTRERAKKLGVEFKVNGFEPRTVRRGVDNAVRLLGVQHIDSFQIVKLLARTGAINVVKMDIESVSEKVFGEYKEKVFPIEINEAWEGKDKAKLERVVDYNLKDSITALRIAKEFLPMFVEVSKLTSQTLHETTRNTTSQMVEDLLMKEVHMRGVVAPNKPKESQIQERTTNPIKGAFVKEPVAGLHEGIAVLDFASLYPSIIISHNISPETLNCSHEECKQKNTSPDGTHFCTKERGLFPEILERMLKKRLALKAEYKKKKKEEGIDDKVLFAKQWALKIVLNSVYGYLGYARARWYSRECASAVTAFARGYIQETIKKAEKAGFEVLYGDTDSNFLKMNDKTKKEVEEFTQKVNKELPEGMELEIDGFYKRGIFVTKKEGGAAKKKYALIDEKGNLKIVGFEYVRRDWCITAKETQKKVIELVLSKGDPKEAAKYVRNVLTELKAGKVPKKDLVIMTLLQRKLKDYDSIGPHVAAAEKAIARGKELGVGSMLSFIITKGNDKASISDKAELEEYVEEGNYDAEYYIENQVLPAVIKIMQELGYSREDLLQGGKQTGLGAWS
ncbi:MAG: DNA-directed DNA polymerase [archaeon]|jgi:DNA polymerase I